MIAEILSTGDEICSGAIIDSNSAHIAEKLMELDIEVTRHSCVGDDPEALANILTEIGGRADISIITGGLGPTKDDLSAEAAAMAAGTGLEKNEKAVAYIEGFFEKYHRQVSESDYKQAMLPQGATPIFNARGTAPGFSLTIGKSRCYFMPGIPHEMTAMLAEQVIPDIQKNLQPPDKFQRIRTLSAFGLPEARVNDRMADISDAFPSVRYGLLARFPVIYIKLIAVGETPEDLTRDLDQASRWAQERFGKYIFSTTGLTIEAEVGKLLKDAGATVAVAESCTGGLIADMLTNISGSSNYFLLSTVTYANSAKIELLNVPPEVIDQHGAVHEETAKLMAEGVRQISGAAYGIATSGIAGPTGGTDEKPVGTVCIGIAGPDGAAGERHHSPFKERTANKQIFAVLALNVLRKQIMKEFYI
ncbi:MAG: CinA family nicotinamide mononucleotide deamidase-related protein [Desulfobacterales bacterium]|nr:CinA family nicotinamide mononucleotide deamidase-related protein [Desulfobacterales bacterium]